MFIYTIGDIIGAVFLLVIAGLLGTIKLLEWNDDRKRRNRK